MQTFRVKADDAGIRLDRWFKRHFPDLPHGQLQKACRKGLVRVNHAKSKTDQRLALSDEITVKFLNLLPPEKADDSSLSPQMIIQTQGWVLWENNDVIVINKPAGLATQGGSKLTDHLDRRLPALQQGRDTPPKLVHRLDKDTSGALLLARSAASAAEYARLFQTRAVQKTYLALLAGVPVPKDGEIESKMEKSGIGKEKMTDSAAGKKAVTAYRVLDYAHDRAALVELQPITGRTHQLRLHMQQLGCPILGDGKYGGASAFLEGLPLPRQLHLHAWQLHIHSKGIEVTAPLPAHLKRSMECLGLTLAQSGLGQKDKKKEKR